MANYKVDFKLLQPYVPRNTEIDLWQNECYLSLVGFMFQNTRLKGFSIPFHSNFEEVNLRFYVRYQDGLEWKRGVVFLREIVPRYGLALTARVFYREPYVTMPMDHQWRVTPERMTVRYRWKKKRWNSFEVEAQSLAREIKDGSDEAFITEHYWGYTRISETRVAEYGVEHPRWKVYPILKYAIDVDFRDVYGEPFSFLANCKPDSVFLAEGSEIVVRSGRILP